MPYKILFLGASYGSLLAAKLLPAGHTIKLVCLPNEVEVINKEGIRVRLPVKGREVLVESTRASCRARFPPTARAQSTRPITISLRWQ